MLEPHFLSYIYFLKKITLAFFLMNIPHHLINGSLVINIIFLVPFHDIFFFRLNSNTNIYIYIYWEVVLVSHRCIKQHKPTPNPINKQTIFIYTHEHVSYWPLWSMNTFWTILSLSLFFFFSFLFGETFGPFFESNKERIFFFFWGTFDRSLNRAKRE